MRNNAMQCDACGSSDVVVAYCAEHSDEIAETQQRLYAEVATLRGLLRELVEDKWAGSDDDGICWHCDRDLISYEHTDDCPVRRAREAVGDE